MVALDCLAIALPQVGDATLHREFLTDTIRVALNDAGRPDKYGL